MPELIFDSALYACSATHWRHVEAGMRSVAPDVRTMTPARLGTRTTLVVENMPGIPPRARSILLRRGAQELEAASRSSLGPGQLVLPAYVHLGRSVPDAVRRKAMTWQASRVAKAARSLSGRSVVQFTDGFGHRLDRSRISPDSTLICERRNLHHKVFTEPLPTVDGFPHDRLPKDPVHDFLEAEYELADFILVYSAYAARTLIDYGVPAHKILVAPIPFAPAVSAHPTETRRRGARRLLFVGRCEAVKGIDLAVAAARIAGCRITVAGPATPDVRAWLAGQEHVDYVGVLDRGGLEAAFKESLCLMLPSLESYGLAALEAAASGLPVVAANTTGAAEYLSLKQFGLVVEGREPTDWAAVVTGLLDDHDRWSEAAALGVANASSLTVEACTQEWLAALTRAMDQEGPR